VIFSSIHHKIGEFNSIMTTQERISTVTWWSFLIFIFTIPFSQLASIRILALVIVFSFFIRNKHPKILTRAWDILLYLLVLIVGMIYSDDLTPGIKVIETSLSLLALPLVFSKLSDYKEDWIYTLFYAFAFGLLVASLICIGHAVFLFNRDGAMNVFFFDQLTGIVGTQPTYMAYYLIAVITFGLYLLYYESTRLPKIVLIPLLFFFFAILMLTGGLTAFVSMLFVFSFFVLKFLLEEKTKTQTLTFGVVVLLTVCMFALNSFPAQEKNDYWERFALWESALHASPDLIFGVGTGDYRKVLNDYYVSHNLSRFADSNFNSHNQFIEILFSNGLIGVVALCLLLGRPLYLSVQNQNVLGTLIFFPFIIYGMTEVFLGRYQGVVFFALLHQTFVTHFYQMRKLSLPLKDV
jgi:O-antigen ligase